MVIESCSDLYTSTFKHADCAKAYLAHPDRDDRAMRILVTQDDEKGHTIIYQERGDES